ncbi:MAG: FIST C-terminal domain-containing protein [Chloroflexi bacterium]|nr:FIST C-terminal domain-containing protein [Chloroflexota bacterium]
MIIEQRHWTEDRGWSPGPAEPLGERANLVLAFGGASVLRQPEALDEVRRWYPAADVLGCTTAGEILDTSVFDDSLVVTAIHFEHTRVRGASVEIVEGRDSYTAGRLLAERLMGDDLAHVFVLSDGLIVNGSDLVAGLTELLPPDVTVTGGLSGDGDRFGETLVVWNGTPQRNLVAAIGLYGTRLQVGYGSLGGWDPFGPDRLITRSSGNVLFELDGQPALTLYKTYLGEQAAGLPSTGLLFPLSIHANDNDTPVVRTILAVSEDEQSMTFAGDLPEGRYARLMKANFERLIDGAIGAARTSREGQDDAPDLAILISCVGRKLILQQRIEEEVEGVREVVGDTTVLTGFYSYGEISPFTPGARCDLHNQTMTITVLSER